MRTRFILGMTVLALGLAGCNSSGVVGTWNGRGSNANAPFSFGSVSFVGDQTFTAEARYGGNTRVQSGTWSTAGDKLDLKSGDSKREYTYKLEGNALRVTDPKSGHSIVLDRMRK